MNQFRKRLLAQITAANLRLWENKHIVFPQRVLREEWDLITDGKPDFRAQPEVKHLGVWRPRQWS
jgi:hypothetical protein